MKFLEFVLLLVLALVLAFLYVSWRKEKHHERVLRFEKCYFEQPPSDTARCHCARKYKLPSEWCY